MSQKAAFFDLDRTMIPGSSLFLAARGLRRRRFFGTADILRFGWAQLVYRVGKSEPDGAMNTARTSALQFVRGRRQSELRDLSREISEELILPRVFPEMAELVAGHRRAGDLTYVVTAAPVELAEMVADGLGMTGALGTRAEVDEDERYTGRLAGSVLHGPAKASAVEELAGTAGVELGSSAAYSDSVNDLSLLELVGRPTAVNPDDELEAVAQDRGWEVRQLSRARGRYGHARERAAAAIARLSPASTTPR